MIRASYNKHFISEASVMKAMMKDFASDRPKAFVGFMDQEGRRKIINKDPRPSDKPSAFVGFKTSYCLFLHGIID